MESILRSLLGRPALNTLLDALIACRAPLPLRDLLAVCHASSGCVPALSDSESCSIYRWDGVPPYSCSTNRKDVLGTGTWGTFPSLGYQGQECNVLHKDWVHNKYLQPSLRTYLMHVYPLQSICVVMEWNGIWFNSTPIYFNTRRLRWIHAHSNKTWVGFKDQVLPTNNLWTLRLTYSSKTRPEEIPFLFFIKSHLIYFTKDYYLLANVSVCYNKT
jgi:hypothetical protein